MLQAISSGEDSAHARRAQALLDALEQNGNGSANANDIAPAPSAPSAPPAQPAQTPKETSI